MSATSLFCNQTFEVELHWNLHAISSIASCFAEKVRVSKVDLFIQVKGCTQDSLIGAGQASDHLWKKTSRLLEYVASGKMFSRVDRVVFAIVLIRSLSDLAEHLNVQTSTDFGNCSGRLGEAHLSVSLPLFLSQPVSVCVVHDQITMHRSNPER